MSWNATPRAMPVMSSAVASANSGPSSFSRCALSHRSSRACTVSRAAPVSCSSERMRTRGRSISSPAMSLPTGSPSQRSAAVGGEHDLLVGRVARAARRAPRSRPRAPSARRRAAPCLPGPAEALSAANWKPASRPIGWPSTTTSPDFVISVSSIVFSRSRRINTLVRRSTKRSARRSCSASDKRSSTPRVMPCQCSGSASQSGRFAAKVQVLMWAIRFASVSISPSVRSACATCPANQSGGIVPSRIRKP